MWNRRSFSSFGIVLRSNTPSPQPSARGESKLNGSLSRARERVGGEAGNSSRMQRARRAVPACKPARALQVRVVRGPAAPSH